MQKGPSHVSLEILPTKCPRPPCRKKCTPEKETPLQPSGQQVLERESLALGQLSWRGDVHRRHGRSGTFWEAAWKHRAPDDGRNSQSAANKPLLVARKGRQKRRQKQGGEDPGPPRRC